MKKIHPDCEKCEMFSPDDDFPCRLEETGSIIRCNILKEYAERMTPYEEL